MKGVKRCTHVVGVVEKGLEAWVVQGGDKLYEEDERFFEAFDYCPLCGEKLDESLD